MIIINENGLTKILAEEGMVLHKEFFFEKQVALGCNSTPEDWNEITDAEAEALQNEKLEGGE